MVHTYKGRGHVPLQREGWLGESYPCHECARLLHSIPLATPSRSTRKRWMQLAVILQSVQTPFRCVRRESDPTQSRNLSAELRIVSYHPPRCRCAQGDAVDRDNVLTRRDRSSGKGGKGPSSHSPRQGIWPTQMRVHVCFDVTILKHFSRSFAQYHYAQRCMSNIIRLSAPQKFFRKRSNDSCIEWKQL